MLTLLPSWICPVSRPVTYFQIKVFSRKSVTNCRNIIHTVCTQHEREQAEALSLGQHFPCQPSAPSCVESICFHAVRDRPMRNTGASLWTSAVPKAAEHDAINDHWIRSGVKFTLCCFKLSTSSVLCHGDHEQLSVHTLNLTRTICETAVIEHFTVGQFGLHTYFRSIVYLTVLDFAHY